MSDQNPAASAFGRMWQALINQPYLLLVIAPLVWGGNITAGRIAVGQIDPNILVFGRWVGAVGILLTFALPHVRRDWPEVVKGWRLLLFYGVVGFTGYNMAIYTAAQFTSAINISIEQAAIPIFVFIGNLVFFAVRPRPLQLVGLVLTSLGVIWVATEGAPNRLLQMQINVGDALVVIACLFYALYSLLLRFRPKIGWITFMFATAVSALLAACLMVIAGTGGIGQLAAKIADITPTGWLVLVYVAIFPSIVAQLCYARGLSMVGPNRASIFINLLPIFGTISSVILLGEEFELFHLIAGLLAFTGIIIAEWSVRAHPTN